jgi:hypothetical protein
VEVLPPAATEEAFAAVGRDEAALRPGLERLGTAARCSRPPSRTGRWLSTGGGYGCATGGEVWLVGVLRRRGALGPLWVRCPIRSVGWPGYGLASVISGPRSRPDVMLYGYGMTVPPEVIYIIRHAEKPLKPPPSGVDFEGGQNEHSLLPRGWQRAGALAALFHPDFGPMRAGLRTPTALVAPSWGHPGKTASHRSYQTIQCLSEQLELPIAAEFVQGQEEQLASSLVRGYSGVVLICWEHDHIPVIASSLPVVSGSAIPRKWPGDRYDVIWSFTLAPGTGPARYAFGQIPQQLLPGDAGTVIPVDVDEQDHDDSQHEHHKG